MLELLEEIAADAGDVNSTWDVALAVFDALYDACGLGALGACSALLCIHDLGAVAGLGNLRHCDDLPETNVGLAGSLIAAYGATVCAGRPCSILGLG